MDCHDCGAFNSSLAEECDECGATFDALAKKSRPRPESNEGQHGDEDGEVEDDDNDAGADIDSKLRVSRVTAGQRMAGGFLILAACELLALRLLAPSLFAELMLAAKVGMFVQVGLGVAILAGKRIGVVLAALIHGSAILASFGPVGLAFAVVLWLNGGGSLLLLVGRASRARIIAGCIAVTTAQFVPFGTSEWAPQSWFHTEGATVHDLGWPADWVTGRELPYQLRLPSGWHPLRSGARERLTHGSDATLVNVKTSGWLSINFRRGETAVNSVHDLATRAKKRPPNQTAVPRDVEPIARYPERSRVVLLEWVYAQQHWKGLRAVLVGRDWCLELDLRAFAKDFEERQSEFRAIIDSVQIPAAQLEPRSGLRAVSSNRIQVGHQKYQFELHGDGWYALDSEVAIALQVPPEGRAWTQPYRNCILHITGHPRDPDSAELGAVAEGVLTGLAKAGELTELDGGFHPIGTASLFGEFRFKSKKGDYAMWIAVARVPDFFVLGFVEVPFEGRILVAEDAKATLRSLTKLE